MILRPRVRSSKNLGQRQITYINENPIIYSKVQRHPIIISGIIKSDELRKLGIDTDEDFYLVNMVTHNFQDKFHLNMKEVNPNYPLKEDLGSYHLCTGFLAVPKEIVIKELNQKIIYLHDKGVNLGQEEASLNVIIFRSKKYSDSPLEIYDPNNNIWLKANLPFKSLNLCKSMDEKKKLIEDLTGNIYSNDGKLIAVKIPTSEPISPLMASLKPIKTEESAQVAVAFSVLIYLIDKKIKASSNNDQVNKLSNNIDTHLNLDKFKNIEKKNYDNGSDDWPTGC